MKIKKVKKVKKIKLILIALLLLFLIKVIIGFSTAILKEEIIINKNNKIISMEEGFSIKNLLNYNMSDLVGAVRATNCNIIISSDNSIVYENNCSVSINIENYSDDEKYSIEYGTNNSNLEKIEMNKNDFQFNLGLAEGENTVLVKVYENDTILKETEEKIHCVIPYKKQFLDELSTVGVGTHFGDDDNIDSAYKLLTSSGTKLIRNSMRLEKIYKNGAFDFTRISNWYDKVENANISVLTILSNAGNYFGEDKKVLENEEKELFRTYAQKIYENYEGRLAGIEVLNEPNLLYTTDEEKDAYADLVNITRAVSGNERIISGATATPYKTDKSEKYLEYISEKGAYENSDVFSYHVYASTDDMKWLKDSNSSHRNMVNKLGGFQKLYLTEYGLNSSKETNENIRAEKIIKQTVNNINQKVDVNIIYNFKDDTDTTKFGLVTKEYIPRKSYYAVKNYLENTNGSEYIGTVPDVQEGLELYIYDKDGTTLGICWSNSTTTVQYRDFVAYDLYGNEIPNTNGTLTITTTPVYLKNMSRLYFYKAIANNAVKNYDEFLTDYDKLLKASEEMLSVKTRIIEMKNTIADIANRTYVSESEAIELMEQHFNIGDMILDIYCRGKVYCKDVEVSSMLDKINTIGEAYEDLVTVAANNTSNARLSNTENNISEFSRKVAEKSDVDPIYPKKINIFAKDYYEIANYINELYEENPIKNGLIVSKGLHAYYLSNWANTFANNYFKESKVEISYSNTDVTNQDVTATVVSNVPIKMITPNMHTFYKNGSYTFRYIINDEEREIVATVDWIDKEKPVITGWENRVDELETVTIRVTDANLSKIVVTRDGVPYAFKNGDTLFEAGNYEIVAYDKVANSAKVTLRIVDYIESNKTYYISNYGSGNGLSESSPMNVQTAQNTRFYAGDKILFKSGQTYNLSLDWSMMGSPDDKIIISSYGTGNKPIINGYIGLVSNLDISNLEFTNMEESSLITRQNYTENVAIRKCTFNNIKLSGIYINRQVKNMEISDCIFKYCDNSGIIIKNDNEKLIASNVIIKNNMFLFGTDGIVLSGTNPKHKFEKVMISDNTFVNQIKTEGSAISIGAIEDSNFDVSVYNNLYYNFSKTYKVNEEYLGKFRDNFRADNNAFYTTSNSAFVNNIKDFGRMKDEYFIEFNSKNQTINESYLDQVNEIASSSISKSEILAYLTQSIIQTEEKKNDSQNELGKEQEIALPEGELTIIANRGFDEVRADKLISAADLPSKNSQEEIVDVTVAQQALPLTGWRKVATTAIVILVVMIAFSGFKYGKYKIDTRRQIRK